MTIGEWLTQAQLKLAQSACPDPEIDSRWLAEDALHMNRAQLRFEAHNELEHAQLIQLNDMLSRRIAGEPVQYILGSADFMGLKLHVDARALIPRADTETLVEAAIIDLRSREKPQVLDLCTGSGAIGLSIASLVPSASVTLSDISAGALEVARKNAHALNLSVHFRMGDLFDSVARERFDLIACNPPYIPTDELSGLQREVQFEPMLALDGGRDGLAFYRRIAQELPQHLYPNASVYLEVGAGEAKDVRELLVQSLEPKSSGIIQDLCGVDRVVWAKI